MPLKWSNFHVFKFTFYKQNIDGIKEEHLGKVDSIYKCEQYLSKCIIMFY